MKASIVTLATLLLVVASEAACTREPVPAHETKAVSFTLEGVSSGPMTKGVADLLAAAAPSGQITLTLRSTTNALRVYQVAVGDETTLALDTYQVTGQYTPAASFQCMRGAFYLEPKFSISTEVTISEASDTYPLPVEWNCFALIKDGTKVQSITATNAKYSPEVVNDWNGDGDLAVVFVSCGSAWDADYPLTITATPVDGVNYEATTWRLTTSNQSGCLQVRNGYWFSFNPAPVSTGDGSMTLTFPAWSEGAI